MSDINKNEDSLSEEAKIINELILRCDHYYTLYMEQIEINKKLKEKVFDGTGVENNKNISKDSKLQEVLKELIFTCDKFSIEIQNKNKLLNHQKTQITYLGAQNMRYKRIMERISSRWYGRLLKKGYHFCCRIGIISPL